MRTTALVAVLTVALASLAAQEPASNPSTQREPFAASTAGIVVDVVVRDGHGRPVTGLTADDFEVFEDGVRQQILAFEPYTPADVPATAEEALADIGRVTGSEGGTQSLAVGPPIIALAWDRLRPESRALAHEAARRLIQTKADGELIGVFLTDMALRIIQPYTTDQAALEAAVEKLASTATSQLAKEPSPVLDKAMPRPETPPTASAESSGLPEGVLPKMKVDPSARGPSLEGLLGMLLRMERSYKQMLYEMQGHASLNAVLALVDSLGELPGRKTVLFFSDGLTIPSSLEARYRAIIDTANRNNVSVYSFDAAGLRVHSEQSATARVIRDRGAAGLGDGFRHDKWLTDLEENERMLKQDPAVSLGILAEQTGGFLIDNTNALDRAIDRINNDRHHHYLLSYTSTNAALDGTYRRIEVKVKRDDVEVRARQGYRAVPADTTAPVLGYEAPALAALAANPPPMSFPIAARALSVPMPGHAGLTALAVRVNGQALTSLTAKTGNSYLAQATIVARVVGGDGRELARTSQQYQLNGELAKKQATLARDILFFRTSDVVAGRHTMEAVVRDDLGERSSVVRIPLEVPAATLPVMGDLFIVSHVEAAPATGPEMANHPLASNGLLIYPSFGEPISKADRPELAFALPLLLDPKMSPPSAALSLLAGGKAVAEIPLPLDAPGPDGRLLQVSRLPTSALPPGSYQLRVTLKSGGRTEVRTTAVTITD